MFFNEDLVVLEEVIWFLRGIQESPGGSCGLREVQLVLEVVPRVLDEVQVVLQVQVVLVALGGCVFRRFYWPLKSPGVHEYQ